MLPAVQPSVVFFFGVVLANFVLGIDKKIIFSPYLSFYLLVIELLDYYLSMHQMENVVIQNNWLGHLKTELNQTNQVRIISPFITLNLVRKLLKDFEGEKIQVITRYNLNDFRKGVSNLSALQELVSQKAEIKGIKNLHSKLYLFDQKSTIITSANFTSGGFISNKEFGIKSYEEDIICQSLSYFNKLWSMDSQILNTQKIVNWKEELNNAKTSTTITNELPDYGASTQPKDLTNKKYFIKFFGKNEHRVNTDHHSRSEIEDGCCHYALSFSRKSNDKRPRKYRDGDVVYMARMIHGNDYAIFGKGYTLAHDDKRDIVGIDDLKQAPWLNEWPILVRVYKSEFIDSTLLNCPKLNDLIESLDYDSFQSTSNRHYDGEENINPWNSLRQQADVRLSDYGVMWLEDAFSQAISNHGKIPNEFIDKFYGGIKI